MERSDGLNVFLSLLRGGLGQEEVSGAGLGVRLCEREKPDLNA